MRLLINSMTFVMAMLIVAAAITHQRALHAQKQDMDTVQQGLAQFDEQLILHGALWQSEHEDAGDYPPQVMPDWFKQQLPTNPLLSDTRPWVDIAPAGDYREHPPDPLADDEQQAAFWYNPNNGIVRARVPRQTSKRLTLSLYNRANLTALEALPLDDDPDRAPLAFNPHPVTTGQSASPTKHTTGHVLALDVDDADAEPITEPQPERPWYENRVDPTARQAEAEKAQTEQPPAAPRPSLIAD